MENPRYKELVERYDHLKEVTMDDVDEKEELPVHLILGKNEYAQIKTETTPKIGKPGEPIAELTRLGWTIMSPGSESDLTNMFLTQTSAADYEALCRLDVLGLPSSWRPRSRIRRIQGAANKKPARMVRNRPPLEGKSSTPP